MSYPRNAASPPTVTLGAILQLSDGAVQTSGASVRVKTGTGAWGAGSGTLLCDSTSGIWTYLPTQGETNDTHFSVAAYKASCIPVGVTVITSASDSAGYAGVDWSKVANPTTPLGLSGTTTKTATDVAAEIASATYGLAALKALLDAIVSYIDTEVGAIKAKTDNLPAQPAAVGDIPTASAIATQVDITLSGSHGAGDWGPGSSGTGAYTLTITVDDGTDPLEGAKVRLTHGATALTATTDVNGVAEFGCDALTYSVAITKQGYSFTPTTKVVSETGPQTYHMTASGPTPSSDPDKTTVRITCHGADTEVAAGATIELRQLAIPASDTGHAYDGNWARYTADASGIVDLTLWSGAEYALRRGGAGGQVKFTPSGATYAVTSVVGRSP